jgi:REP-associated tyrosine transposase
LRSSTRIHVVFSTQKRQKRLREELRPNLLAYIAGPAKNHGFEAIKIGSAEDHCHALILLPAAMPLSKAVQTLKGCSSKGLNDTGVAGNNFAWQEGYGAFSVSASQTDDVVEYIKKQPEPHTKRNYEEEFLELLKRYGIAYDPAHVLG